MSKPCAYHFGLCGRPAGGCSKGAACPFSHDPESAVGARLSACAFHFGLNGKLMGTCGKGAACLFSHDPEDAHRPIPLGVGGEEVKAAGVLVGRPGGLFYLVRNRQGLADPGGKIKLSDLSVEAAAAREFEEETGLTAPPLKLARKIYIPEAKYCAFVLHQNYQGGTEEDPTLGGRGEWLSVMDGELHPRLQLLLARLGVL